VKNRFQNLPFKFNLQRYIEEHKLLFSFLLCTSILRANDSIAPREWNVFLRGSPLVFEPGWGAARRIKLTHSP
jgi:hypothetical protein